MKYVNLERPIVERNFQRFIEMCYPTATPEQVDQIRIAYYSGAWWLLSFQLGTLADGQEETAEDLALMEEIHKEIETFVASIAARGRTKQ